MKLQHSLLAAASLLALCAVAPAPPAAQPAVPAAAPWTLTYREVGYRVRTFTLDSSGHATAQSGLGAPHGLTIAPATLASIANSIEAVDGSSWATQVTHAYRPSRTENMGAARMLSTDTAMTGQIGGAFGESAPLMVALPIPGDYPSLSSQPMCFLTVHRLTDGKVATWTASWTEFQPTTEPTAALDLGSKLANAFGR